MNVAARNAVFLLLLFAVPARASAGDIAAGSTIHPGDRVSVTVYNHPELSTVVNVTAAGDIDVPVAGKSHVVGLTEALAGARIAGRLQNFMRHPSAEVRIVQQVQSIFFSGPLVGVQPYEPGETISAAIGAFAARSTGPGMPGSGGVDLRRVRVSRYGHTSDVINVEELARTGSAGMALEPGDTILLAMKPNRVDVVGDVRTPGPEYLYSGETVAQAVTAAGGFSSTTSLTSILLHRNGVDTRVTAAGPEFSGPIQDGDIVTLEPAPHATVLGMVEKPGDAILQAGPTLLNALYAANGPNKYADLAHVRIIHSGETRIVNISALTHGDVSQSVPISDGDVVFVPEGRKIDAGAFANIAGAFASLRFIPL